MSTLTRFFRSILKVEKPIKVTYVSSYIPRHCGIATYTKDLTNAINLLNPNPLADIVAIHHHQENVIYPWEVKCKITDNDKDSYVAAATYINKSNTDVISLEHEFGLYGGDGGDYIFELLKNVQVPIVTTFHTVVEDETSIYGKNLKKIADLSVGIIVMMEYAAHILVHKYNIDKKKIIVIPHGVPDLTFNETALYKHKRHLEHRIIMGNINLLSPNKGIEFALEAVAKIAQTYPNVLYMIIGKTHPNLLRSEGEVYRKKLQKLVRDLNIKDNVRFVNIYLSINELIDWLKSFDFYVTPYIDRQQVTSGALAYAIGAGKACISTPYIYAKEVLADNRGVLVPFQDSSAIATAVIILWENQEKKLKIEQNSYAYGRFMTWTNVAQKHLNLFRAITL